MQDCSASLEIQVQFDEVDSFRIVHHAKLVVYLERARLVLLKSLGFPLVKAEFAVVLYSLRLDFKKPARLLESLQVISKIERVEGFKLVLSERIQRGSQLLLKAATEIAFVQLADLSPVPVDLALPGWPGLES